MPDREELINLIEAASGELVFLDEDAPADEWRALGDKFAAIHEAAGRLGWIVVADAAKLAQSVSCNIADQNANQPAIALSHLNDLASVMGAAAEEANRENEPKHDFKAELSQVKIYLADMNSTTAQAVSSSPAQQDEDSELLETLNQRITAVEDTLLNLDENTVQPAAIAEIFREFHTLKGETGILGLSDLNRFFHDVESALDPARNRPMIITGDFIATLMGINDHSHHLINSGGKITDNITDNDIVTNLVNDLTEAVTAAPDGTPPAAPQEDDDIDDDFFAATSDGTPADIAGSDTPEGAPEIFTEDEYCSPLRESPATGTSEEPVPEGESIHTIPVDVRRIDTLLELVTTVTSTATQVSQNPAIQETAQAETGADLMALTRATRALQDMAVSLRMMPVRPLFQRMRRAAFDVSHADHKPVEVIMEGAETELDRSLAENLTGPLVHIIRNAIDHGIESPARRRELGKPEKGRITLAARRSGSDIVIEIKDDGQGLNADKIRTRALAHGLIHEGDNLTDRDLYPLIFHPGLSTAERVTGFSGRGVGMDAVQAAMRDLRGKVEVDSSPGVGTTVKLIMPLTLAAIEGLIIRIGRGSYVIPASAARESFRVRPEDINSVEGRGRLVSIRGAILPIISLGKVLDMDADTEDPTAGVLVVVEHGGRLAALLVDEVLATNQVVVRPLEGKLSRIRAVSGSALLGGRQVALVLEVRELIDETSSIEASEMEGSGNRDRIETVDVGSNQVGMVDFHVDYLVRGKKKRSYFAINAFKAREFVPLQELTPLPQAPEGFMGVLLLREATLPVVDLRELLDFEVDPEVTEGTIIVCEFGSHTLGIAVSGVNRVNYISWQEILPPPESGGVVPVDYIVGTILLDEEVIFVLDFEHIVQKVIALYREFGEALTGVERRKTGSRVLLVEDSKIVRMKTAEALRNAGLEIIEATNGQEAQDILLEMAATVEKEGGTIFDCLDLVLSDIEMPQLDGYTLTRTVKSHPQLMALPVILHSSLTNETVVKRAKEVHADGVVGKRDPEELALLLRQYL